MTLPLFRSLVTLNCSLVFCKINPSGEKYRPASRNNYRNLKLKALFLYKDVGQSFRYDLL